MKLGTVSVSESNFHFILPKFSYLHTSFKTFCVLNRFAIRFYLKTKMVSEDGNSRNMMLTKCVLILIFDHYLTNKSCIQEKMVHAHRHIHTHKHTHRYIYIYLYMWAGEGSSSTFYVCL